MIIAKVSVCNYLAIVRVIDDGLWAILSAPQNLGEGQHSACKTRRKTECARRGTLG